MANKRLTDLTAFSGTSINDNDEFWIDAYNAKTVTFTQANPGVFTVASHGLSVNNIVVFSTTGTLPTNIVAGANYYVISSGLTTNEFQVSATLGGTAIDTTAGSVSGTHTATYYVSRKVSGLKMKALLSNMSYSTTFTPGTVGVANTITHNLNSTDLVIELWDVTTGEQIMANIDNRTVNAFDIKFTSNPAGNVRVVVVSGGGAGISISGGGTNNYIAKWTPNGDTLGNSLIRDDGNTLAVNADPTSNSNKTLFVQGKTSTQECATFKSNYTTNIARGVVADVSQSNTFNNVGLYSIAKNSSSKNIGAHFIADENGAGGLDYAIKLQDGSEGTGKVLCDVTGSGDANWGKVTSTYTTGATGTFTTNDGKTVTVTNGLITSII